MTSWKHACTCVPTAHTYTEPCLTCVQAHISGRGERHSRQEFTHGQWVSPAERNRLVGSPSSICEPVPNTQSQGENAGFDDYFKGLGIIFSDEMKWKDKLLASSPGLIDFWLLMGIERDRLVTGSLGSVKALKKKNDQQGFKLKPNWILKGKKMKKERGRKERKKG